MRLHICLYACVYVSMHVYMWMRACVRVRQCACVRMCTRMCVYVYYMYMCIYIHICVCIYVAVSMCMCECVYAFLCAHTCCWTLMRMHMRRAHHMSHDYVWAISAQAFNILHHGVHLLAAMPRHEPGPRQLQAHHDLPLLQRHDASASTRSPSAVRSSKRRAAMRMLLLSCSGSHPWP